MNWLERHWLELFSAFGGTSGFVSAGWTVWTRHRAHQERMLDRLSLTTTKVPAGLRVDVTFEATDRAEPLAIAVRVLTPNVHAVERVLVTEGGPSYDPATKWQTRSRGRRVEVSLAHPNPTSTSGTATFALVPADAPEGSISESSLSMSRVSIRVLMRTSRKRLISTTRTISAAV